MDAPMRNTSSTSQRRPDTGAEYLRGLARWWVALSQPDDLLDHQYICVDTDVITMFHSPGLGAGYTTLRFLGAAGKVDSENHSAAAAALAAELARYVLYELETTKQKAIEPRLLLPGHAEEVMRKFADVMGAAEKVFDKADEDIHVIAQLAKRVSESVSIQDEYQSKLALDEALRAFVERWLGQAGKGPATTIDSAIRFAELLARSNERIRNVTQFRFGVPFDDPNDGLMPDIAQEELFGKLCVEYCKAFRIPHEVFAHQKESIEKGVPSDLTGKGSESMFAYTHATDVYALAWLRAANEIARCRKGGDANDSSISELPYMVIISGAGRLKAIGGNLVVDPLNLIPSLLKRLLSGDDSRTVSELLGFVEGILYPIFKGSNPDSEDAFEKWCTSLALGTGKPVTLDTSALTEKLSDVERAWETLCRTISAKSNRSESLLDKIRSLLEGTGEEIQKEAWVARIRELFSDAKVTLITKVSLLHPSLQFSHHLLPRNPPPVRLEKFPEAKTIADDAILLAISPDEKNRLKRIIEGTDRISRIPYLSLLLTGILESASGNWRLARVILWAAFVEGKRSSHEDITGRDAAYALAIASRVTVSKKAVYDDLAHSANCLNRAIELDGEKGHVRGPGGDVRFRSEKMALDLSKVWIAIAHPELNESGKLLGQANYNQPVTDVLSSALSLFAELQNNGEDEKDEYLKEYVFQQTCCIAIQAWLLSQYVLYQGQLYQPLSITAGRPDRVQDKLVAVVQAMEQQSQRLKANQAALDPRKMPTVTPLSTILGAIARATICVAPSMTAIAAQLKEATELCEESKNWAFPLIDSARRTFFRLLLNRIKQ
jgi:hypothetical protein